MSGNSVNRIIQEYLDRVAAQLSDLPPEEREEIIGDLRSHIEETLGDPLNASEADVRNTLERLGDPVELAQEARQRSTNANAVPVEQHLDKTPTALEVAAIILTALFWPIGVILMWISQRWLIRDKVIATAIPVVGSIVLLVLLVGGMTVSDTTASEVLVTEQVAPAQPVDPADPDVDERSPAVISETGSGDDALRRQAIVFGFLIGTIASPFLAAVYLAIRLQPVEVRIYPDGGQVRGGIPAGGHA